MAISKQTKNLLLIGGAGLVLYYLYNQSQASAATVIGAAAAPGGALMPPDYGGYAGPSPSSGGISAGGYDMTTGQYTGP